MKSFFSGIKTDLDFIHSHQLQPGWYKLLKVFILFGALTGYWLLFGWRRTVVFFAIFVALSLLIHLAYRSGTHVWTRSWLDFVMVEEGGRRTTRRIGVFYYGVVLLNALLSFVLSQWLVPG